tara:strand:+ start:2434 stop:2760 length:327 start_codon:yes stop_codon:yes gene_type:complete
MTRVPWRTPGSISTGQAEHQALRSIWPWPRDSRNIAEASDRTLVAGWQPGPRTRRQGSAQGSAQTPEPEARRVAAAGHTMLITNLEENGAGDEIRTHDIHLGKVTLYP